jgi:5S rRNA maturation endonuclease (ribonuclease M5)
MKKHIDEEKLEIILKNLRETAIIVEGKWDEKALKSLGLKDIIAINGRPLYQIAEIANTKKDLVILTDFDKKGRQIEKKLRYLLQKRGKQPNLKLRWKVMTLGKNKIEDFGVLRTPGNISFGEDDFHVKTCANLDKIRGKSRDRCTRSYRET